MKKFVKKSAFSIAEAMITLLIVSLALAAAAPIMSKRINSTVSSDGKIRELERKIHELEENIENIEITVPKSAIVFFARDKDYETNRGCPLGWTLVNMEGRYPRVTTDYKNSGNQLNQMVLRHRHLAGGPYPTVPDSAPFNYFYPYGAVVGNKDARFGINYVAVNFGGGLRDSISYPTTNDGTSQRVVYTWNNVNYTTANELNPNQNGIVGEENRPNSVLWIACKKN